MMGKLIKGRGARGVLDYLLAPSDQKGEVRPRVKIVGGTFAGHNAREISAEFGALHRLRPQLGVHVIHESLRLPGDDAEPDDAKWAAIAQAWVREMGIEDFVAVAHGDGHIHIAASRIKRDGSVVSDQHDYKRSEAAIRKIEIVFGLKVVESSHLLNEAAAVDHHKAPTRGQMIYNEIVGETPPAMFVAAVLDDIIDNDVSVASFINQLETAGIKVHPNIATTGRMNGFAYEVDGIRVTSKAMGRGFTWKNLLQRGLSYEPDRDDAALSAAKSKRQSETSELIKAEGGDRPAGRGGQDLQSIRQRHGNRRQGDPGADGGDVGIKQAAGGADAQDDRSGRSSERSDNVRSDDLDHLIYLAAAELDIGRGEGDLPDAGRSDRAADKGLAKLAHHLARDLSRCGEQVGRFIQAVGASEYQVMTRTPDTDDGKIKRRKWTAEQMLDPKNIRWLRSENVNGAGIFIRAIDRRVTLLDDVTRNGIAHLAAKGFEPCVSGETSPQSYQAWIRLVPAHEPEPSPEVATDASRRLTNFIGGDTGAIGNERFGRLPGFTNRKPKHQNDRGRNPWVTIIDAAYRVAMAGRSLISLIEAAIKGKAAEKAAKFERRNAAVDAMIDRTAELSFGDVETLFIKGLFYSSGDPTLSQSEIDFRACGFALKHGSTQKQTEDALLKHSPSIDTRHPKTENYAARTVCAAASSDWLNISGRNTEGPSND